MSLPPKANIEVQLADTQHCTQAGYLPVPLRVVPPESLDQLNIYLATEDSYSLYRSVAFHFSNQDVQRLIEGGVEFVYVSVHDHQVYYRTMESAIENIVTTAKLQKAKKAEILYATSLELVNQLITAPPQQEEIERAMNISRATVQLILDDQEAFECLFETFNHDFYTATHMVNVCSVSIAVAEELGCLEPELIPLLGTGSLLHDVGKIFIPDSILNSERPLSFEEQAQVRSHVERGCQHLTSIGGLPDEVMAVVAEHHERIDGSGYPKGLKHNQISPLGRLAGIVDTFEAMTSVRPYRDHEHTYSIEQALDHIDSEAGKTFDPEIAQAFIGLVEQTIRRDSVEKERVNTSLAISQGANSGIGESLRTQYYFRIPITVKRLKQIHGRLIFGPAEQVIAHKISRTGIGLLSSRPIPADQSIYITAPSLEKIELHRLLAVVTSCRGHGDGWFSIDAQFHTCQSPEIINKLKQVTDLREVTCSVND